VCFFQVAQGADLGQLTIGRHGQPTRFGFHEPDLGAFIEGTSAPPVASIGQKPEDAESVSDKNVIGLHPAVAAHAAISAATSNRVFITHGRNKKILDQVKEIVTYGGFEPVVAIECESGAKPVPEKVMADMRICAAAVIHVAVDAVLFDKEGNERVQINGNVFIEIGAAMALYPGYKFILLVEEGLKLPSNLQGLYECRYTGEELSGGATMKLLKAFKEFKSAA
jgi:predicted nucleotide-binding protein